MGIQPMKALAFQGTAPDPLPPEPTSVGAAPAPAPSKSARAAPSESAAVQRLLGIAPSDQQLHHRCCTSLSWEERLMGFLGCYAIGLAISLSSILSFPLLLAGHPTPFAWKYSVGNCLSLVSSGFLVGPRTQCEQMASPVRLGASATYVLSIAATVVSALLLRHALLTLLAMAVQFCALSWYCASYIPFGRMCIRRCVGRACCPV